MIAISNMKGRLGKTPKLYLSFLIFWAYLWGGFRYIQVMFTNVPFDSDAVGVWRPFAKQVLSGATPYTPEVWDNKPPFFQLLNIIAESTGHYFIVMILFVASANAAIVYIIYRVWSKEKGASIGLLAGTLFLSALSYTGTNINSKTFAILFVLLAIFWKGLGGFGKGILTASGILFAQQVVFAGPVIIWVAIQKSAGNFWSIITRFTSGGIFIISLAYGSLALVYNYDTMIRSLHYTNGITTRYFTRGDGGFILSDPSQWLISFLSAFDDLAFLIIAAMYGSYIVLLAKNTDTYRIIHDMKLQRTKLRVDQILLLLLISLTPALLLRAEPVYWILFFPSLSGIAAVGILSLIADEEDSQHANVSR
jgi:hypothetical protein